MIIKYCFRAVNDLLVLFKYRHYFCGYLAQSGCLNFHQTTIGILVIRSKRAAPPMTETDEIMNGKKTC